MKKKLVFFTVLGALLFGAVFMSYGTDWVIDVIGLCILAAASAVLTFFIVKNYGDKKRRILSLVFLWVSFAVFCIAGFFRFSGAIILFLTGVVLLSVIIFIEYKRKE